MSRGVDRAAAQAALESADWSGGEVVEARPAKIVFSTRIPAEYSDALAAEADRRGLTPSALISEFVVAGLRQVGDDTVVTFRFGDLRQAIINIAAA